MLRPPNSIKMFYQADIFIIALNGCKFKHATLFRINFLQRPCKYSNKLPHLKFHSNAVEATPLLSATVSDYPLFPSNDQTSPVPYNHQVIQSSPSHKLLAFMANGPFEYDINALRSGSNVIAERRPEKSHKKIRRMLRQKWIGRKMSRTGYTRGIYSFIDVEELFWGTKGKLRVNS